MDAFQEEKKWGIKKVKSTTESLPNSPFLQKVRIRVIDEGFGVKEELKQRIFEKYEVGKVMKGVAQLGLGLAFCKMVVVAHCGEIFVEDNQPKGAIFTIIL